MVAQEPVRLPFNTLYAPEDAFKTKITETIYTSTHSPPPKRRKDGVQELCTIEWDTEMDISSLPTYTNPLGKVYYVLGFEVEMVCAGGSLDFAVYHNGKRQGSRNITADSEPKVY